MLDPREVAVIIFDKTTQEFVDQTVDIKEFRVNEGGNVDIFYGEGARKYSFGPRRVCIAYGGVAMIPSPEERVVVDDIVWPQVEEVLFLRSPTAGTWAHIRKSNKNGTKWYVRSGSRVSTRRNAAQERVGRSVMKYWRAIAEALPEDDPTREVFLGIDFVDPESALGLLLSGSPRIPRHSWRNEVIYPFRVNRSQQDAVTSALTHSISVIEGPPGTGKTETILNLISNVVGAGQGTIGIVSLSNDAVDNVADKLTAQGLAHIMARLGRRAKVDEFLAQQPSRNASVDRFLGRSDRVDVEPGRLAEVGRRITDLLDAERELAEVRDLLEAHELEVRHFDLQLSDELADLSALPVLRRSSNRIVELLAESEIEHSHGIRPGLVRRIKRYFQYGSASALDLSDTQVVLALQRLYYERRIAELGARVRSLERRLRTERYEELIAEYQRLSLATLEGKLCERYRNLGRAAYDSTLQWRGASFSRFIRDYPVLLSSCHSLRRNLPEGVLLDYLVIDEASQVDLLSAAMALSCCRHLVVVGDVRQISHIAKEVAVSCDPPRPEYDYASRNLLAAVVEHYPNEIPRTLLREHYRCHPAIIGFCNRAFYDGQLIPFTTGGPPGEAMMVVPTSEGNHMRQHRGGGRSNMREVDVIGQEVIRDYCSDVDRADIGVATPYRQQVDKLIASLDDEVDSRTVHKYQGRQKRVMIMSTVLDETWRGQTGLKFVDEPTKINVAVSRAVERFILVTNNDALPRSKYLRDLVQYIKYQNPGQEPPTSDVISVFDLLYQVYSKRLNALESRLDDTIRFKSERIIHRVLSDILKESDSRHLRFAHQVLLRTLVADMDELFWDEQKYVRHRASLDFVVYSGITNEPVLVIEVDGFKYHEDNPEQLRRDAMKDRILGTNRVRVLRLPTTGSDEEAKIRAALAEAQR